MSNNKRCQNGCHLAGDIGNANIVACASYYTTHSGRFPSDRQYGSWCRHSLRGWKGNTAGVGLWVLGQRAAMRACWAAG